MRYLIALMLLVLVGCASVNFTPSSTQSFPAHTGDVAVLERLPDKYQEVGWVSVDGMAQISTGELLLKARDLAGSRGANAIIFNGDSFRVVSPSGSKIILCRAVVYDK